MTEQWTPPPFAEGYQWGTYVAGRWGNPFKMHQAQGHARSALTTNVTRMYSGNRARVHSACALYRLTEAGEWEAVEVYPAGSELPWRLTT